MRHGRGNARKYARGPKRARYQRDARMKSLPSSPTWVVWIDKGGEIMAPKWLGIGVALGAGAGVATHNIGLGVALGVAIGAVLSFRAKGRSRP